MEEGAYWQKRHDFHFRYFKRRFDVEIVMVRDRATNMLSLRTFIINCND